MLKVEHSPAYRFITSIQSYPCEFFIFFLLFLKMPATRERQKNLFMMEKAAVVKTLIRI